MRNASSALAYATVTTARNLKAACIITPTVSGATARVVSKFKPKTEIIGISPNEDTLRRMQIYWGVRPYCSVNANSTDEICSSCVRSCKSKTDCRDWRHCSPDSRNSFPEYFRKCCRSQQYYENSSDRLRTTGKRTTDERFLSSVVRFLNIFLI